MRSGHVMRMIVWFLVGTVVVLAIGVSGAIFVLRHTTTDAEPVADGAEVTAAPEEPLATIPGDPLAALDAMQRAALMRWLAANTAYELVMRDYCRCAEQSGAYPYLSAEDFNGDKHSDIAVLAAMKGGAGEPMALFVFNGPFDGGIPAVAFTASGWQRNDALFGTYVGPTESDNGYSIKWKDGKYQLAYQGDGG